MKKYSDSYKQLGREQPWFRG